MGDASRIVAPARRELVAGHAGRLDALLAEAFQDLSRSRIQRLIADGNASVDGVPAAKSARIEPGASIVLAVPPVEHDAPSPDFDLPVLFEDEAVIAVDKPAGLAVHGAPGDTGPAVAGWMLARLGDDAAAFDAERPGIIHRLDKDTTGVLLLARTPAAQAFLSAQFESRNAHKSYLALTDGVPANPTAVIDAAVARHPADRTKMAIARRGRAARTQYETLATADDHAFLLIRPETGRTHQIRVHLAAIDCPVRFDRIYGHAGDGRQLLHAWRIEIPHPEGGTLIVTAPLPEDFVAALRALGLEKLALEYTQGEAARIVNRPSREGA